MIKKWIEDKIVNKYTSYDTCLFTDVINKDIYKIIDDFSLFKIIINSDNCKSQNIFIDIIKKSNINNIYQIFTNNCHKKIIIIEDYDISIKMSLNNILENSINKNIPIICIIENDNIDIIKKCSFIKNKIDKKIINIDNSFFYKINNKIYDDSIFYISYCYHKNKEISEYISEYIIKKYNIKIEENNNKKNKNLNLNLENIDFPFYHLNNYYLIKK